MIKKDVNHKHAYLIMAHNNYNILKKIIEMLDDKDNDIYIHIDKKSKTIDKNKISNIPKYSKIVVIKSIDVRWSKESQIECELLLLKEAIKKNHKYYHLISGSDIPIKKQSEIHDFFNKQNKEFIHFRNHNGIDDRIDRINYYHLFTNNIKSENKVIQVASKILHEICISLQKLMHINRSFEKNKYRDGANWFSITHKLAEYIISNEKKIKKIYNYSYCADEIFIQTLVYNSSFYDNLYSYKNDDYDGIKRLIDWKKGNPYNYCPDDFESIIKSDMFFVRKVQDEKLVDLLYKYIKENK